jgi:molecular chaperone DnaJ
MAERKDYYDILGVPRAASQDDIRAAYRRLARQYHPDVNHSPEAAETFKDANEAYQVLNDPTRRQSYDRFGHAGLGENGGFEGFTGFGGLGDIFEDLFGFGMRGSARAHQAPQRGSDLQTGIAVSFREAVFGCTRDIEVARLEPCDHCGGTGAEPGTTPVRCTTCGGSGEVRRMQQTILGSFVNVTTCPTCGGRGEVISTRCGKCVGERQIRRSRTIEFHVPAGVDDGMRVRLSGEGDVGLNGGPPGNLYVTIQVEADPQFRRRENDVVLDLPISFAQAALGAVLTVPTLEGEEPLKVPAGTQSGRVIKLKGKGVPHLQRSGRGDQLVVLRVVTPTSLTPKQRQLIEELAETFGDQEVGEPEPGFIDRMKGALGI